MDPAFAGRCQSRAEWSVGALADRLGGFTRRDGECQDLPRRMHEQSQVLYYEQYRGPRVVQECVRIQGPQLRGSWRGRHSWRRRQRQDPELARVCAPRAAGQCWVAGEASRG